MYWDWEQLGCVINARQRSCGKVMFSVLSIGVLLPMMHWTSTYRRYPPSPRLRTWTYSNLPNFNLTVQEPHPSPPRDMGHVQTSLL